MIDAYNKGHLIIDPATDSRVEDQMAPDWSGPSENWQGSSAGRDYTDTAGEPLPKWLLPEGPFDYPPISPLVFDLDGDGIDLVKLEDSHAYFDLNLNGFAEKTAWIKPDDGFLALDRNSNGAIDDRSELFGGEDADGFTALSQYDSNSDGVINAQDTVFADLKVWRDQDGDGLTDAGELASLTDLQITSIKIEANFINRWIDGNWISHESTFQTGASSLEAIYDVWFANDQMHTIYRYGEETTYDEEVMDLPDLTGYGTVANLRVALQTNPDLRQSFIALISSAMAAPIDELYLGMETLLQKWAGVDGVISGTRGSYIDARHIAFLEALHGRGFVAWDGSHNPGPQAGSALEEYYNRIISSLVCKILVQVPLSYALIGLANGQMPGFDIPYSFLLAVRYDAAGDKIVGDVKDLVNAAADVVLASNLSRAQTVGNFSATMKIIGLFQVELGASQNSYVETVVNTLQQKGLGILWQRVAEASILGDVIVGTDGSDTLATTPAGDLYVGLQGNDSLNGGAGNDTYLYALGDGSDTITEDIVGGAADKLVLEGINQADASLVRNGNDVTLVFSGGGSVLLKSQLDEYLDRGVDQIQFADGTLWTRADLRTMLLAQASTSGNDTITGFNTADTIRAGTGTDTINGGSGSDTYLYALGDGSDTITDNLLGGAADKLVMEGINPFDVNLFRDGTDLALKIGNDTLLLKGELDTSSEQGIEQIIFTDGPIWTQAALNGTVTVFGDGDNDGIVLGTARADSIDVRGGKTLKGGSGSDTYAFSAGYGNETVVENSGTADVDVIDLSGLNLSDVAFYRVGNDLRIDILSSGEKLLATSQFLSMSYGIEQIRFTDGTVLTRSQVAARSVILGTAGKIPYPAAQAPTLWMARPATTGSAAVMVQTSSLGVRATTHSPAAFSQINSSSISVSART